MASASTLEDCPKINPKKIEISHFENLDSFIVVDIRGKQSFEAGHLKNSIHLPSQEDILNFLKSSPSQKPIAIVCFSGSKAKEMANKISDSLSFSNIYYRYSNVFYFNTGIMELSDSGFPITQSQQKDSKNTSFSSLVYQTIEEIKLKYLSSKRAFIVAFSGGKDSTCVLQLIYEMLAKLDKQQRRPTFAIASNTLVEAPHIEKFLQEVIDSINIHARENQIPFKIIQVTPNSKDQFWVNLIGKGYPSPTRTFRWCTDRLKITPTKEEVSRIVHQYGSALLCLGTRKSESTNRKKSMEKRILNEEGYSQHHDFPNTLTYSPIAEWSTDDVWGYLISHKPIWAKDHSELFSLYSKASGDECQFITDLRQNSCGGSRFGCWVCTVVNEDKSLLGFIDSGETNLKPLNDFRNFIKELREDSKARADYKRDGRAVYKIDRLGPFLSSARIQILQRLLDAEKKFKKNGGGELISDAQILEIQKIWDKDFDFNNTAIKIAKEFNRMENIEISNSEVLHKEILEAIAQKDENIKLGIDSPILENIITKSIDISSNTGPNNAAKKIKEEIEKFLNEKTAKQVENGDF